MFNHVTSTRRVSKDVLDGKVLLAISSWKMDNGLPAEADMPEDAYEDLRRSTEFELLKSATPSVKVLPVVFSPEKSSLYIPTASAKDVAAVLASLAESFPEVEFSQEPPILLDGSPVHCLDGSAFLSWLLELSRDSTFMDTSRNGVIIDLAVTGTLKLVSSAGDKISLSKDIHVVRTACSGMQIQSMGVTLSVDGADTEFTLDAEGLVPRALKEPSRDTGSEPIDVLTRRLYAFDRACTEIQELLDLYLSKRS